MEVDKTAKAQAEGEPQAQAQMALNIAAGTRTETSATSMSKGKQRERKKTAAAQLPGASIAILVAPLVKSEPKSQFKGATPQGQQEALAAAITDEEQAAGKPMTDRERLFEEKSCKGKEQAVAMAVEDKGQATEKPVTGKDSLAKESSPKKGEDTAATAVIDTEPVAGEHVTYTTEAADKLVTDKASASQQSAVGKPVQEAFLPGGESVSVQPGKQPDRNAETSHNGNAQKAAAPGFKDPLRNR